MKKKQVFWGAGKIGQSVLAYWQRLHIVPDFFCDNERTVWGRKVGGIRVLSPHELYQIKDDVVVFITCACYTQIKEQLFSYGMLEEDIVVADYERAQEMTFRLSDVLYRYFCAHVQLPKAGTWGVSLENEQQADNGRYQCLIDLSAGMVLGGVERWSYTLGEIWKGIGIKSAYLFPENCVRQAADDGLPQLPIQDIERIPVIDTMRSILSSGARLLVCNFPFDALMGACMVKKYINPNLKIIAVLHNDEGVYYKTYALWEKYIDVCLTISSKIRNSLLEENFPASKIRDLYWRIPCDQKKNHSYSLAGSPLQIGYAGRIVVEQKRVDLLLDIAERLKGDNVDFRMNLAGGGEYVEQLQEQAKIRKLDDVIHYMGVVEHAHITDFWRKQDICISCSEWEGHSISHSEAMAAGAVPVITDTSGARDDVEDGVNGYVADVGDLDMLVNRIAYLHGHRSLLHAMGSNSQKKVIDRNKRMEPEKYWKALLNSLGGLEDV